jgi:hypothetical protein
MKLQAIFSFCLATAIVASCGVQRQVPINSIAYREQLASEIIAEMLRFEFSWRFDIDPPIFVDSILKVRGNIYAHDSLVFGEHISIKRRALLGIKQSHDVGVLRLPKRLQDSIHFLPNQYDFEQDSVDYRFYSLPVLLPEHGIYVMEEINATQNAYSRTLGTSCFCFDVSRKKVDCPQDFGDEYFSSNYWGPILQPKRWGPVQWARHERYKASADRKRAVDLKRAELKKQ